MIQLRQLVCIAEEKILSRAAEKLNISQSALSRSVQRLEEELGILLFDRTKNSMALNKAGETVVKSARVVLSDVDSLFAKTLALKNKSRHLAVATCAPAPLWKLTAELSASFPAVSVSQSMPDEDEIVGLLLSEKADLAIVRKKIESDTIETVPFMDEQLFMQIPLSDPLSAKSEIHFSDLSGKEIREYTQIGFWKNLHREMIGDAKYIQYDDFMVYANVVKSQNPLTFVTELGNTLRAEQDGCAVVPIADAEATAHYSLAYLKKNRTELFDIINWAVREAKSW